MSRQDEPSEVNRPQTTIPSLWHLSAVATTRFLDSALSELTPAAVASGCFQEGDIVDALYALQVDVDRLAISRMCMARHPNEDVQTLQSCHPTNVFTQEVFGSLTTNCVERLHSLQLVLYHTPIYTGDNKT
jgi:hypothetical protein